MKTQNLLYFLAAVAAWCLLFYRQLPGANYLLFHGIITALLTLEHPGAWRNGLFRWFGSITSLLAVAVAIDGSYFSAVPYWLLTGAWAMQGRLGLRDALISFAAAAWGYASSPFQVTSAVRAEAPGAVRRGVLYGWIYLLVTVGVLIVLSIFVSLYSEANPAFKALADQYIPDFWASIELAAFAGAGALVLAALTAPVFGGKHVRQVEDWYTSLSDLPMLISAQQPIRIVHQGARVVFACLCGFLLVFLVTDLTNSHLAPDPTSAAAFSRQVHESFDALIVTFLLTVLLLLADLHILQAGRALTATDRALFWVLAGLNAALIADTVFHDAVYILHSGLTFNRLALLFWMGTTGTALLLAAISQATPGRLTQTASRIVSAALIWFAGFQLLPTDYLIGRAMERRANPDVAYTATLDHQALASLTRLSRRNPAFTSEFSPTDLNARLLAARLELDERSARQGLPSQCLIDHLVLHELAQVPDSTQPSAALPKAGTPPGGLSPLPPMRAAVAH